MWCGCMHAWVGRHRVDGVVWVGRWVGSVCGCVHAWVGRLVGG